MEIEQIPALTPYKDESYFDYRKEYLSVEPPHVICGTMSITDTTCTDTAITANTLNSLNDDDDDDDNDDNDHEEDIDIKSETEFMDDEEHRATMLKLYHPAPKIKTKPKPQNSYSKTDKSISPELLRMSKSTEPPSFNNDNVSVISAISTISGYHAHRVRPHIIDNNTEMTESRLSASFNFDFVDSQRAKCNKHHLNVTDERDRDEADTASDKFAAGFIGDDDDDDDDDDDEEDDDGNDDDDAIKTNDSKSKRSHSKKSNQIHKQYRKKSTKSKSSTRSKSSRHKHITHGHGTGAKYRDYNSNSNTITISRTNSEGSITNYNVSDIDPNHEDLEIEFHSNFIANGRPVPIIRRVVGIQNQIQNNVQTEDNEDNKDDDDGDDDEGEKEEEEEEIEDQDDITNNDTNRLFVATVPQPRYLSISVSESTEQMEFEYNNNKHSNHLRYNYQQTNFLPHIPQPRASEIEKTEHTEFSSNKVKQSKPKQRQKCKSKLKLKSKSKSKSKSKTKLKMKSKPKLTSKQSKYKNKTPQNGSRASKKVMKIKQKHKQKKKQQTKKKLELERARSHNVNINNKKHYFNNAPLHNYNHYSPKHQQYSQYSQSSDASNKKTRPLTMRCISNKDRDSFKSQFSFDSINIDFDDNENIKRDLEQIIEHFWKVIDIASNKKIPFEILKISLRVKSIDVQENNWDILLNELTNFQPSKNITLTMFKDFIFNKKPQNTHYHRNAHIVKTLRKQLIVGLLATDDRKLKLSNKYSGSSCKSKTHYLRYHDYDNHDPDAYDHDDDDECYKDSKMKTIKFHIIPANKTSADCKSKTAKHKRSFSGYDETKSIDTLEEFGGKNLNYFVQTGNENKYHKYKNNKDKNWKKNKYGDRGNKDSYGGRARSSSHHSYLQSMRSSITSYQSHKNASEYVKYTVQQSIIGSLVECVENESLNKLNKSRMRSYSFRNEWRKSLKYLLRCFFAHLSENQDVFTLEQFKFALYDECNIRYEFSHHILPILKLNTDDRKQQYVITEHSFVDWMLKHIDQMMNLRATQSLRDRHLDKLLNIISYHESKAKKKKQNPFIAISPPVTKGANEAMPNDTIESNKLRLLKAKSMNAMNNVHDIHDIHDITATTDRTSTSSTTTNTINTNTNTTLTDSTSSHIRRAYIDNNHLHLHHHHTSRHHYSTSHGVAPHESIRNAPPNHKYIMY